MPRGSDATCTNGYGSFYNTTTMVCYGGIAKQDVCSSDSGGPIAINGKQVGLVSYGSGGCNGNVPSVFTKVYFFRDFVNSVN
ncbi:hypothetical protein FQR65_LT02224 [Abscondita terminalis]|nr:hypothetical protein FQR65_LT02224 [Abscondita terminalis]